MLRAAPPAYGQLQFLAERSAGCAHADAPVRNLCNWLTRAASFVAVCMSTLKTPLTHIVAHLWLTPGRLWSMMSKEDCTPDFWLRAEEQSSPSPPPPPPLPHGLLHNTGILDVPNPHVVLTCFFVRACTSHQRAQPERVDGRWQTDGAGSFADNIDFEAALQSICRDDAPLSSPAIWILWGRRSWERGF